MSTAADPAAGFDPARVRADFPALARPARGGRRLVYLDNAATTQKPAAVLAALDACYREGSANVHRALHQLAEVATRRFEAARAAVAAFIGAPSPRSVVFTRGATESINLVAHGWGRGAVRAGDELVVSEMEHHSNLIPWQRLAAERGARLRFIPVSPEGVLDLDAYRKLLNPRVRLVAVTHVSNVLGTVNPVRDMAAAAHAAGALFLVDGAQSVPHRPVDVGELDCDFLVFSGHKMAGPTGIGALYGREALLEAMDPFMTGGEMISRVTYDSATWAEIPHKFEAGTPDVAGAIGLGAAVAYLQTLGMAAVREHEQRLTGHLVRRLEEVPGLRVVGRPPERGGAVSFDLAGLHPHDIAQFADGDGVALRAGHMCAQPLLGRLGFQALCRASLYVYNTEEDVDALVRALRRARDYFGHGA